VAIGAADARSRVAAVPKGHPECDIRCHDLVAVRNDHIGLEFDAAEDTPEWTLCEAADVILQHSETALCLRECMTGAQRGEAYRCLFSPGNILLAFRDKRNGRAGSMRPTIAVGDRVLAQFNTGGDGLTSFLYPAIVRRISRRKWLTVRFESDGVEQELARTSICPFGPRQH
jgi:hypothetical protein